MITTGLQWVRPSLWRREWELRAGGELVATMRCRGAFRQVGIVESADRAWTFERVGWFRNDVVVRAGEREIATFRSRAFGHAGELIFASGQRFEMGINFWMSRLEVRAGGGEPIVVHRRHGFTGRTVDVEVAPSARTLPELIVLVTFGWFLFAMLEQDASAAAVTG